MNSKVLYLKTNNNPIKIMTKTYNSFALSLSGGGARGIFHAGFLQALDEANLKPEAIAGASMGAIVGAFYAAGVSPREMLKAIKTPDLMHFRSWIGLKGGIGSMAVMREQLLTTIGFDNFDQLSIPLTVSVTNINTGKSELITSGNLIDAVVASASIPVVFAPVKIGDQYYLDGGLTLNMPINCLEKTGRLIIGLHCNYLGEDDVKYDSLWPIIERSLRIVVNNTMSDQMEACDLYVSSKKMQNYHTFDFEKANEIFDIGYASGLQKIPEIKQLLT